jgi:hypothetical protein
VISINRPSFQCKQSANTPKHAFHLIFFFTGWRIMVPQLISHFLFPVSNGSGSCSRSTRMEGSVTIPLCSTLEDFFATPGMRKEWHLPSSYHTLSCSNHRWITESAINSADWNKECKWGIIKQSMPPPQQKVSVCFKVGNLRTMKVHWKQKDSPLKC